MPIPAVVEVRRPTPPIPNRVVIRPPTPQDKNAVIIRSKWDDRISGAPYRTPYALLKNVVPATLTSPVNVGTKFTLNVPERSKKL